MKSQLGVLALAVGLFCGATSIAQAAAPVAKASSPVSASVAPAAKATAVAKAASNPVAKAATTAAAGGGDGKVWVNTKSKTYHCEGTKYYGKTKVGEYMTEAEAKAKGNHPDHGKVCTK